MEQKPLVSLCIPTNGVEKWVFPVLDSIFNQGVSEELFEVVVTDNGNNSAFKAGMEQYLQAHENIVYAKTEALPFINEIESYRRASGELIKFVNHRTLLVEGALQKIVEYVTAHREEKPVTYFTNGVLKKENKIYEFDTFDSFVRNLSYWSSWSTGMTIWKSDFEKLPKDLSKYNELFPHTDILFFERTRGKYVIDNTVIFDEMPQGKTPKGSYDLFGAFGIEYPWILCTLLKEGSITTETFRHVTDCNLEFIASLYVVFCIKKAYASYDLSGLENIFGVFYSRLDFWKKVLKYMVRKIVKR